MAKRQCKFKDCKTKYGDDLHMYRFPKDQERCQKWVEAAMNEELKAIPVEKLHNSHRICECHFDNWCFMNPQSKQQLTKNAIPALAKTLMIEGNSTSHVDTSHIHTSHTDISHTGTSHTNTSHIDISHIGTSHTDTSHIGTSYIDTSHRPIDISHMDASHTDTRHKGIQTTPQILKAYTPKKKRMARLLKSKTDSLKKIKAKNEKLKKLACTWKTVKPTILKQQLITNGMTIKLANFIARQTKLSQTKSRGQRYTIEDKLFAYTVLCKSKASYRILRKYLLLPSEATLRRFISSKFENPGLCVNVISAISNFLKKKPPMYKNYVLIFDEMSLKPYLVHNQKLDTVIGFEDRGTMTRTQLVANQLLVLMVRSLCSKKKMPIGFYFSRSAMSADLQKNIILEAVEELSEADINVRAIICDQGANNIRLFSILGATKDSPFFFVNEKKIFTIFDPPHLLKSLRRNLMKYDLMTTNGIVSFKHIVQFYNFDKTRNRQCAPKLTDKHLFSEGLNSMKVALASQVFSNTVAAGMSLCVNAGYLPSDAEATIDFIGNINDLFDSFNGTSKKPLHGKPYHCVMQESSPHFSFWEDLVPNIEQWKFLPKNDNEGHPLRKKRSPRPQCQSGWIYTIKAATMLYHALNTEGIQFLITRRLNQDCIENFFSRIRGLGGNRSNPCANDIQSDFKLMCINSCTQNSRYSNCEEDEDKFCIDLVSDSVDNIQDTNDEFISSLSLDTSELDFEEDYELELEISEMENDDTDNMESNVIFYIAGYVAKKCLQGVTCNTCIDLLKDSEKNLSGNAMYTYFKSYKPHEDKYGLIYPSSSFMVAFTKLVHLSDIILNDALYKPKVVQKLKSTYENTSYLIFLSVCGSHYEVMRQKIVDISARLCLKIHLREVNRCIQKHTTDLKKIREKLKQRGLAALM